MATSPLSVEQFAAKIKAKYPDYASVPDDELAKKIVEKYPEYRTQVSLDPAPVGELPGSTPRLRQAVGAPEPQPEQGFFGQVGTRLKDVGVGMAKEAGTVGALNVASPVAGAAYTLAQILRGSHKEATEGASPLGGIPIIGPMAGQMGRDIGERNYGGAAVNAAMLAPTPFGAARGATTGAKGFARGMATREVAKVNLRNNAAKLEMIDIFRPSVKDARYEADIAAMLPRITRAAGSKEAIVNAESPTAAFAEGTRKALIEAKGEFENSFIKPAEGVLADTAVVSKTMKDAITNRMRFDRPGLVKQIERKAAKYDRPMTVSEIYENLNQVNNELEAFSKASPSQQRLTVKHPTMGYLVKEAKGLRATLYKNLPEGAPEAHQAVGQLGKILGLAEETAIIARRTPHDKWGLSAGEAAEVGVGAASGRPYLAGLGIGRSLMQKGKKHPDIRLRKALEKLDVTDLNDPLVRLERDLTDMLAGRR